jgi:hypothetical protein
VRDVEHRADAIATLIECDDIEAWAAAAALAGRLPASHPLRSRLRSNRALLQSFADAASDERISDEVRALLR